MVDREGIIGVDILLNIVGKPSTGFGKINPIFPVSTKGIVIGLEVVIRSI